MAITLSGIAAVGCGGRRSQSVSLSVRLPALNVKLVVVLVYIMNCQPFSYKEAPKSPDQPISHPETQLTNVPKPKLKTSQI